MPARRDDTPRDAGLAAARGRVNEPMAKHASWRAGGPAALFFRPASPDALVACLRAVPPEMPILFVGLGSNLLVRDGGVEAAVIAVQDALTALNNLGGGRVYAGAGLACTVFARHCVRQKLGPAEFFAGIPGTIGGALRMNAGAFGGETWDRVEAVEVINRQGQVSVRTPAEYRIAYREVQLRGAPAEEWFIGATFRFDEHCDTSLEHMRALVNQRKATQPLGLPSCGSVFRNPPDDHAARLIEACGLKGFRIGGAEVSTKHANFIINTGSASATDIEALIDHVQSVVEQQHGVTLLREVHIVGAHIGDTTGQAT